MLDITEKQLNLLHHTLGVTPERRAPYRNHFVAGPGHHDQIDLEVLEAAEMMRRAPAPRFCTPGDEVFSVTDAGRAHALDNLPPAPPAPKLTKYDEFLDADYGHSFADWLGITLPKVEYSYRLGYRYERFKYGNGWTETVLGEWKPTKAEARASYKEALRKHQEQQKQWRTA